MDEMATADCNIAMVSHSQLTDARSSSITLTDDITTC